MYMNKRALALLLGLFFYLYLPLEAQESSVNVPGKISGNAGSLWVDDDGYSYYWHSSLALNPGQNLNLSFSFGEASSNLPLADISIFGFMGQCSIDTPMVGFTFAAGFFDQSAANIVANNIPIYNEGGQGYFFSAAMALRFGFLSINPFLLYGKASWDDGDMYWFFGKPKIPCFLIYGLNIYFYQQDGFKHGPGYYSLSTNVNFISNKNESLFDSDLDAGFFFYKASMETVNFGFTGTIGGFLTKGSFDGAITSANQPYFLFPYQFYNINASFDAQAGFALFRFRHNIGISRYSFDLGAIHIFDNNGKADIHYRMKNLFSGKEDFEERSMDIKGLGAAFLSFEAAFPALILTQGLQLSLGLRKSFIIPWGYDKLITSSNASSGKFSEEKVVSKIRTVLLSGLSISGSISW